MKAEKAYCCVHQFNAAKQLPKFVKKHQMKSIDDYADYEKFKSLFDEEHQQFFLKNKKISSHICLECAAILDVDNELKQKRKKIKIECKGVQVHPKILDMLKFNNTIVKHNGEIVSNRISEDHCWSINCDNNIAHQKLGQCEYCNQLQQYLRDPIEKAENILKNKEILEEKPISYFGTPKLLEMKQKQIEQETDCIKKFKDGIKQLQDNKQEKELKLLEKFLQIAVENKLPPDSFFFEYLDCCSENILKWRNNNNNWADFPKVVRFFLALQW